jgi:hypothetical protein
MSTKQHIIEQRDRLNAAKAETAALRKWRRDGADPTTRPETPTLDEAQNMHSKPKPAKRERTERQPSPRDLKIRAAFTDGTITHPATTGEIAALIDERPSSTQHAVWRMEASGELEIVSQSPKRVWLKAAGKSPAVPERPQRARKVHTIKGNGKTVHAAHAHRGDNGTVFETLCHTPATLMSKTNGEVTCKRCTKVLAETVAA